MRYRLATYRECKAHREWNTTCPSCGRRGKFSPYIDTVTNEPIAPKECGRCCREKSCAYHMTPSEWFKEHPTEKREWLPKEQYVELMRQRRREARVASPPALSQGEGASSAMPVSPLLGRGKGEAASYLSRMFTLCHQSRSDKNNLARWLCTQFPEEQVAEVLARYRTGSSRDGRIIYWQIDEHGQVRAGKVMAYDLDGHRMKGSLPQPPPEEGACSHREQPPVCWVHSMKIDGIRFDEMLVPQCLFGEHLASPPDSSQARLLGADKSAVVANDAPFRVVSQGEGAGSAMQDSPPWEGLGEAPLCLVESEKTAIIMSLIKPDTVWLATGGKANFKEQMLWPLLGHEVAVYPDADALHDWAVRIAQLNRELGHRLYIPTGYYNLMDHDEARREGWDLADILLREEGK